MTDDAKPISNGRRLKTLQYDEADAPMLASALRLGANVAFCGQNDGARARMKQYARAVMEHVPPEADFFNMQDVWSEIMMAIDASPSFEVRWKRADYGVKGTAEVVVGKRSWRTDLGSVTKDGAEALGDALERLAPMECVRIRSGTPASD